MTLLRRIAQSVSQSGIFDIAKLWLLTALGYWPSIILIGFVSIGFATSSEAKQHRSQAARHAFVKSHPCPANDLPRLPCIGYIIDHVIPLCAGGEDAPSNMQWQTIEDAKEKDKGERKQCAYIRNHG